MTKPSLSRLKKLHLELGWDDSEVWEAAHALPALIRAVEAARAVLEANDTLWAKNGTALLNYNGIGDELRAALSEIEP